MEISGATVCPRITSCASHGGPGRERMAQEKAPGNEQKAEEQSGKAREKAREDRSELTKEEELAVKELKRRDAEVKAHEMAHLGAGGQYVRGGASFEYQTGPDGRRYAVGGEVSIDTSPVAGDPKATIRKMQTVRRAALAPAQPSGQDRSVAAAASQAEAQARQELMQENKSEPAGDTGRTAAAEEADTSHSGYTASATPSKQPATAVAAALNIYA